MVKRTRKSRNGVLLDKWSLVHLAFGFVLGLIVNPILAIVLLIAWEPFEIFILSPVMARFNVVFGYETLKNSLSDMLVDCVGVLLAILVLLVI